ncbi:uncharacterized protein DS421_16g547430 [Arachis hypogaea]|nr:uncharacterized protein DS421_16g547430 [Arachis hypogaea]
MFSHSRNRLIKRSDLKAQCIKYIHSQPVNSISDELHGGSLPITTIEEVLDKTNETSCWILATVVSIEVGGSDCTGCIGLIIWNQEAKLVIGKSASEVKNLSGVDQSVSNLLPASFTNEAEFDVHSAAVVSLSKDSGSESLFKCGLETPGKGVVADSNAGAAIGGLCSLDVQGSTTKPLKVHAGKRKLE